MSTLSHQNSKGEKPKQKFATLDINNLYRVNREQILKKTQQKSTVKSTVTYKQGMQILGKVPNARRAPINLPSLKLENSVPDTTTSSIPPLVLGWVKQESASSTSTISPTTTSTSSSNSFPELSSHQAVVDCPVTTIITPEPKQELSSMPKDPTCIDLDTKFMSELSLQPQKESSRMHSKYHFGFKSPSKNRLVPLDTPPRLPARISLTQQIPLQFPAIMTNLMDKNSFATREAAGASAQIPHSVNTRNWSESRLAPRLVEPEKITPRPIIKKEELIRMNDIDKDLGWTVDNDIDYDKKLVFSDDESSVEKKSKQKTKVSTNAPNTTSTENKCKKSVSFANESLSYNWSYKHSADEILRQQRLQHKKELELTIQRAKQRKEEEEKRYIEATKQGAVKKDINPSAPKPKERNGNRDSQTCPLNENEIDGNNLHSYGPPMQVKGTSYNSQKYVKETQRGRQFAKNNNPSFSREFKNELPPRFQKQRNNLNFNLQNQMHIAHNFNGPWTQNGPVFFYQTDPRYASHDRNNYSNSSKTDSNASNAHIRHNWTCRIFWVIIRMITGFEIIIT